MKEGRSEKTFNFISFNLFLHRNKINIPLKIKKNGSVKSTIRVTVIVLLDIIISLDRAFHVDTLYLHGEGFNKEHRNREDSTVAQ